MGEDKNILLISEYATLRTELLENKKYVFERPLLIITATGIASLQLSGKVWIIWLLFLLTIMLLINLWFTVNRLQSIARIAAYICVVLEKYPEKWIGWENSLRAHRIWQKKNKKAQAKMVAEHFDPSAVPDAMMFYPPLYLLHVATVTITLAVSIQAFGEMRPCGAQLVPYIAMLGISFIFAGYCLGPYYPTRMRDLIEHQRVLWMLIFEIPIVKKIAEPGTEADRP